VSPQLPKEVLDLGPIDFIYSFDVYVHVDLHTFHQTLLNLKPLMTTETRLFLSVANLCSDLGFSRFSKQRSFKVAGFYCKFSDLITLIKVMSPDIVRTCLDRAGYQVVQTSCKELSLEHFKEVPNENLYYQRDILFVVKLKST
jgi:hypothetical protein